MVASVLLWDRSMADLLIVLSLSLTGMQLDTHWGAFVAGRVFAGVGVGAVSCLVPMYQSETAPRSVRGLIVGLYQWA